MFHWKQDAKNLTDGQSIDRKLVLEVGDVQDFAGDPVDERLGEGVLLLQAGEQRILAVKENENCLKSWKMI